MSYKCVKSILIKPLNNFENYVVYLHVPLVVVFFLPCFLAHFGISCKSVKEHKVIIKNVKCITPVFLHMHQNKQRTNPLRGTLLHSAMRKGWAMWLKYYITIFLGYISIDEIYRDIFKSRQKHFIDARAGRQNLTLQCFWPHSLSDVTIL